MTRITLSHERRKKLFAAIKIYYQEQHEEGIGDLNVEYFEEEEPRGP